MFVSLRESRQARTAAIPGRGQDRIAQIEERNASFEIEAVHGTPSEAFADDVASFWRERGTSEDETRRRLPEVVCLLRSEGMLAGVSAVRPADVSLIGNRRFWIYDCTIAGDDADASAAMITATFNTLQDEFVGARGAPIGLCALLSDEERRRRPEAEWSDPRMIYAGYLADGRQVRIAYFKDAVITLDDLGI
jgi:hypothetical protein